MSPETAWLAAFTLALEGTPTTHRGQTQGEGVDATTGRRRGLDAQSAVERERPRRREVLVRPVGWGDEVDARAAAVVVEASGVFQVADGEVCLSSGRRGMRH